jgi:hypothetical protein
MEIRPILTADQARDHAIEWQQWASTQSLSWGAMAEWGEYFAAIAEKFDLVDEFHENGII